jgi:retron-type reverse transcriptase
MKTYNNLFNKICSFQNLHLAYLKARKCKRYRNEILKFSYNLETNLTDLQKELSNQTYKHGSYREFTVCDLKKRQIKAPCFRDRVVHHALCNVIEPIFDKGFIYSSFACRRQKGTHKAIKRLKRFIKSAKTKSFSNLYCLECDISKYFDSINQNILFSLVQQKISDKKVLWLIKRILDSSCKEINTGIPIGNLTSQLFANIYLDELDKFTKHKLRIKYYIRYMDDFLILDYNKTRIHQIKEKIQEFLQNKLRLKLHPKKANVFPVKKSINFLGYQIFNNHMLLRKNTVKRFIKRIKVYQIKLIKRTITKEKFNNSLDSWMIYAGFANSWRLRKDLSRKLGLILIN